MLRQTADDAVQWLDLVLHSGDERPPWTDSTPSVSSLAIYEGGCPLALALD
jgi:hypothetical protein